MLEPSELEQVADVLIIGGEALAAACVAPWRTFAPETRLINEYGPTETVVGCGIYEVRVHDKARGMIPIGTPIANTQFALLDAYGHLVPIGVRGELCIGGLGVARGYKDRPDLTAERFVPNPFAMPPVGTGTSPVPMGTRLYRTGDVARYRADGTVEYLGRIDHQVKLRGF